MSQTADRAVVLERQLAGASAWLLPFLLDDAVTDILINGVQSLYVERGGQLLPEPSPYREVGALSDLIERLLIPLGKRIDAAHPYVDGRLLDGSRFHVILPPVAVGGPFISIRKLRRPEQGISVSDFAPAEWATWLIEQVTRRRNILIAGGTGVGKTTLISRLLDHIPESERLAILEESLEIPVRHPHVVRLEARSASPDGKGEVGLRTLVRNTLRMRPDRVILGEVRGDEALELLQIMNTGHAGTLCTLHASGALDALRRLEGLALLAKGAEVPIRTLRDWIGSSVHEVVYLERIRGGRRVGEILSVRGLEGEVYRIVPRYRATP